MENLNTNEVLLKNSHLSSRSELQAYEKCNRYWYYQYIFLGTGVVPVQPDEDLAIGSAVHAGCEWALQNQGIDIVAGAQEVAFNKWIELHKAWFLFVQDKQGGMYDEFKMAQAEVLIRALVKLFCMKVVPLLIERYEILEIEKEEVDNKLMFAGRTDVIVREKNGGDLYIINIKTTKEAVSETVIGQMQADLQTFSETHLVNSRLKEVYQYYKDILDNLDKLSICVPERDRKKISTYLEGKVTTGQVRGVQYIYLIKSRTKEESMDDGTVRRIRVSPLLRAYRHRETGELAHSWEVPRQDNKSGKGIIGNKYEPFLVWGRDNEGVDKWMDLLAQGIIQPECGDILAQQFYLPPPFWVREDKLKQRILELETSLMRLNIERRIVNEEVVKSGGLSSSTLAIVPQASSGIVCNNFLKRCMYYEICHRGKEMDMLVQLGEMIPRVSNHPGDGGIE